MGFVGASAVTLLVCLINVLDLHVVRIAKLYVIKNLEFIYLEMFLVTWLYERSAVTNFFFSSR